MNTDNKNNHLQMSLAKRINQLKDRNFALYLISIFLGSLGGGLSYIVLAWSVSGFHQGILPVVILILCFWLPSVLLGPLAGVVIDFVKHRSRILSLVLAVRAVLYLSFFLFCWLTGQPSYFNWWCYGLALVSGICMVFYSPTMTRYTREIIPHHELIYANTSVDMAYEFGNVIGMGLAGILIAVVGPAFAVGVIGLFFGLAGICFLWTKPGKFRQPPEISQGFVKNFLVAMQYLKTHQDLLIMAGVQAMMLMIIMVTPVLLAPFAREVLHASSIQFGDLEVSLSGGMVLTAILLPFLVERFGFKKVLMIQLSLLFVVFLAFSGNTNIEIAGVLYFLMGLSFSCWPLLITEIQNQTPQKYQGRIQSTLNSLTAIGVLIVYFLLDAMGHFVSLAKIYWVESAFVLICMALLFFYRKTSKD